MPIFNPLGNDEVGFGGAVHHSLPLDEYLLGLGHAPVPLRSSQDLNVFCPPFLPPDSKDSATLEIGQCSKRLYKSLQNDHKTIYLAQHPFDFAWGASPGQQVLFSPHDPVLSSRLVASCQRLISFRIAPAAFALRSNVPAVLVTCNQLGRDLAKQWGIPSLSHKAVSIEKIESVFNAFPWQEVQLPPLAKSQAKTRPLPFEIALITSQHYIEKSLGLIENLKSLEPSASLHVLCLDPESPDVLEALTSEISLYRLEDIWPPETVHHLKKRSLKSIACASKSALLRTVVGKTLKNTFYFDSDIYFFKSPRDLEGELRTDVLLFPHRNETLENHHKFGVFNAGMIGVSPRAKPFLDWWADRCIEKCSPEDGYFWDQGYLDMVPSLFDVSIYKGQRHNLGPWNSQTLKRTGQPADAVNSFHAAHRDEIGFFEHKTTWDQVTNLLLNPAPVLDEEVCWQQARHWSELDTIFFFAKYIPFRLHLPRVPTPLKLLRFLLSPPLISCLKGLRKLSTAFERPKRQPQPSGWQRYLTSTSHYNSRAPAPEKPVAPARTSNLKAENYSQNRSPIDTS